MRRKGTLIDLSGRLRPGPIVEGLAWAPRVTRNIDHLRLAFEKAFDQKEERRKKPADR